MASLSPSRNRNLVVSIFLVLGLPSLQASADPATIWHGFGIQLGGAIGSQPKYEGSRKYRVFGLPLVMPVPDPGSLADMMRRRIVVKGPDNVQIKILTTEFVEAGPVVGYSFGRKERDGTQLGGLGNLDGGPVAGAFLRLRQGFFRTDVSFHKQLSGDIEGFQVRFGVGGELPILAHSTVGARIGGTFADRNYMQSYFGVSEAQSLRSTAGLPVFSADAGLKDINVELYGFIKLTHRWSLRPSIRYSRLLYDAEQSPLIETVNQFFGNLALTYKLNLP